MEKENIKNFTETWSFKKIITGLVILVLLISAGYFIYQKFFAENNTTLNTVGNYKGSPFIDIKGASTAAEPPSFKNDVSTIVNKIKDDIAGLTPESISSSSSKIQEIINKLKTIQEKSSSPADAVCSLICNR